MLTHGNWLMCFLTDIMAFMAMRKNLDERQRQKNLDEIFAKFDKNHNGRVQIREFAEVSSQLENRFYVVLGDGRGAGAGGG